MFSILPQAGDQEAVRTARPDAFRLVWTGPRASRQFWRPARRTALVIGGNGFVGSHLAAALATSGCWSQVVVLVRGTVSESPRARFHQAVGRWEITLRPRHRRRILVLPGSLSAPHLGIPSSERTWLRRQVTDVFQVAGDTSYTKSYEQLRESAVLSLLPLLDFCMEGDIRKRLHVVGTIATDLIRSSQDFRRPAVWFSGYFQAKWIAAHLLRQADEQFGIPTCVYQAPYITGSQELCRDPALAYSFWQIALACSHHQLLWDGYFLQQIPVDLLCRVMILNALRRHPLPVVRPVLWPLPTRCIAGALGCQLIPPEAFFRDVAPFMDARTGLHHSRYSDILHSNTQLGDLDRFIDPHLIPAPEDLFVRGFHQPEIQRIRQKLQDPPPGR